MTKGHCRKLNALRKSVGEEIGQQAFATWLSARSAGAKADADTNAQTIVDTLWPLIEEGTLAIPRGGYLIRRGRGRIIVEREVVAPHTPAPLHNPRRALPKEKPGPQIPSNCPTFSRCFGGGARFGCQQPSDARAASVPSARRSLANHDKARLTRDRQS